MREVNVIHIPATEGREGDTIIRSGEEWRVEDYDADGDDGIAMAPAL